MEGRIDPLEVGSIAADAPRSAAVIVRAAGASDAAQRVDVLGLEQPFPVLADVVDETPGALSGKRDEPGRWADPRLRLGRRVFARPRRERDGECENKGKTDDSSHRTALVPSAGPPSVRRGRSRGSPSAGRKGGRCVAPFVGAAAGATRPAHPTTMPQGTHRTRRRPRASPPSLRRDRVGAAVGPARAGATFRFGPEGRRERPLRCLRCSCCVNQQGG